MMTENEQANEQTDDQGTFEIELEYRVPAGMLALYSDHALVQHTKDEFILSFFQVTYPPSVDTTNVPVSVPATCISRIVLSPKNMEALVSTLAKNLLKFRAKKAESADTSKTKTESKES